MTFIPFEILITIFGVSFALPLLGYLFRTAFPMSVTFFISGSMWLIIFLTTDSIALGETVGNSTTTIIPITTDHMNQPTGTTLITLRSGAVNVICERVANDNSALLNDKINQVTFRIDRAGNNLDKDIYFGVWDSNTVPTVSNARFIIGQFPANMTSASDALYTVTRNDTKTHMLKVNDCIGIFYNGGTVANNIAVSYNSTASSFDGTNSNQMTFTPQAWSVGTVDIRGKISLVESTAFEDVEITTNEYELRNTQTLEPTFVGLVFILLALSFMIIGLLVDVKWTS